MSSSPNDNNNPSPTTTKIEIPSAAEERRKYRREALLNSFARLIHSSATVSQVCDHFQITRFTYYRWLKKVASRERKFMERNYDDVLTNEVAATAEQFKHIISVMNKIMIDEQSAPADKIDAAKLAGEVRLALLTLYGKGASSAWTSLGMPIRRVITEEYTSAARPALMEESNNNDIQEDWTGSGHTQ